MKSGRRHRDTTIEDYENWKESDERYDAIAEKRAAQCCFWLHAKSQPCPPNPEWFDKLREQEKAQKATA